MFDVLTWSHYPEVNKAVNVICEELANGTSHSGYKNSVKEGPEGSHIMNLKLVVPICIV